MVVFLLEERSMESFLKGILPQIIMNEEYRLIPHEGKGDLLKSIPNKLKGWSIPNTKFVIIYDQDSNDCIDLKKQVLDICKQYNRDVLVRIVCRELEAWYFGDLSAVEKAYGKKLDKLRNSRKYKNPDVIDNPKEILKRYVPELTQIDGAKRISKHFDIDNNSSHSFHVFVNGLKRFISCESN
ncbi:MAG: DUF4276 family protein [Lachnospiraceae bacterium]|nr:DUF4276 family protein [Lachnospiraceae bacterium]